MFNSKLVKVIAERNLFTEFNENWSIFAFSRAQIHTFIINVNYKYSTENALNPGSRSVGQSRPGGCMH